MQAQKQRGLMKTGENNATNILWWAQCCQSGPELTASPGSPNAGALKKTKNPKYYGLNPESKAANIGFFPQKKHEIGEKLNSQNNTIGEEVTQSDLHRPSERVLR